MSIKNCHYGPDTGAGTGQTGRVLPDAGVLSEKKFCCKTGKKRVQYPQEE